MKVRLKLLVIVVCLMGLSYFAGSFRANYHWFTYWLDTMASGEQNSVKYSLIYMEKYMAGDSQGAHDWIESYSISDPEWLLKNSANDDFFSDALSMALAPNDNNLMSRIMKLRIKELHKIEQRQNLVREYINARSSEKDL